jgi:predicted nucleic acid-binding protein
MLDPKSGPFLFDTSAEGWFKRTPLGREWLSAYVEYHPVHVSSITVFERLRGYALLWRKADAERQLKIDQARTEYLQHTGTIWPLDMPVATVAAEIAALLPTPPSPARRAHRIAEGKQDRLARWRADTMIAATALATGMLLLHNNAADFETIRGAIERDPTRFPALGPLHLMRCESAL